MRSIFLVLLSFLLLNCEDKHSGKKTNNTLKETTQTTSKNSITEIEVTVEPETNTEADDKNRLTDENAMEFFLQYEKENPENKVRITTAFGNIDILLFKETKFHRANFIFLTKQGYLNPIL